MPEIRPFRALRYDAARVGRLDRVVAPPYDVISPAHRAELAARDPRNVVHVDLPVGEAGEDPGARYERAGGTFAAWRADGTLRLEDAPSLYVHEQVFALPGAAERQVQRGFYACVRLEPLSPGSGIRPHERTMAGPKEDRLRLMRATGANLSGVVALYADATATAGGLVAEVAAMRPDAEVVHDGTTSRLWVVPADGPTARIVTGLRAAAGAGPITIADGHHRYETALRYRDEREQAGGDAPVGADAAPDYLLMLLLDTVSSPPLVLPTHRVVRLPYGAAQGLVDAARALFTVEHVDRQALLAAFRPGSAGTGGRGRFGLWTRAGGAILRARPEAFTAHLPAGVGPAVRRLDVTLLAVALERLAGIDSEATTTGGRIVYTHAAEEAVSLVEAGGDGADAAFLLEPTGAAEVAAVAAEGGVMPQKSTFFYPKPLTGLVINPLEQ
ncbi:MAG: DUF1015 domain-containing protein [Chloroflexi bacterium]|nr:DUF1015 domain-containing protein [Chloroflexota bacterium]